MSYFNKMNKSTRLRIKHNLKLDNNIRFGLLTCELCKKPLAENEVTIDHKYPVSLGGTNHYKNLQLTHFQCNLLKGNKIYV